MLLEDAGKIEFIVEAAAMSDFTERQHGIGQQFHSAVQAAFDEELGGGASGQLPENPAEMGVGD